MSVLSAALLTHLVASCAVPGMVPQFWPLVVKPESGNNPYAIGDDTTQSSHFPVTAEEAEALVLTKWAQHHSVGVGLAQLTARSEAEFREKFHASVREALEPCANIRISSAFYVLGAVSIYHTGDPVRGFIDGYVARLVANYARAAAGNLSPGSSAGGVEANPRSAEKPRFRDLVQVFPQQQENSP